MFKQVHHLGFAVYDLQKVIDLMKNFYNIEVDRRINIVDRQMEAVMFKVGETYLEYLAPLSEESQLFAHLQKKGEGFHHIAYLVDSIEESINVMPSDAVIKTRNSSVGNWKIADLDSKYALGFISQIIESNKSNSV